MRMWVNLFGKKLKSLRKNKGISQTEFGNILGLATSTVSGYEKGNRMPDLNTLNKIADYFGVSVDYLLDRDTEINNTEKEFIVDLGRLTLEEIIQKYNLVIDNQEATLEEIQGAIAWIKAHRQMGNK